MLAEMKVQIALSRCINEYHKKPSVYRAEKFIRPSPATPPSGEPTVPVACRNWSHVVACY